MSENTVGTLALFFPDTSKSDVKKALLVILITILGIFIPAVLGAAGLFTKTPIGWLVFAFLLLGGFLTYAKLPYRTKSKVSEVTTIPLRSLSILFSVLGAGWVAQNVLNLDSTASRVVMVLSSSLIEFMLIFNLAMYVSILVIYLIKRAANSSSEIGHQN